MQSTDLKNWLVSAIRGGEFSVDGPVPTRHELMQRFGVARATVDRVIGELRAEGLVYSRRGAGTFVAGVRAAEEPRVYIISHNRDQAHSEGSLWEQMFPRLDGRVQVNVLPVADVQAAFSRLTCPGVRLVWDMPAQEHFALIGALERAQARQILINRRHPGYNYVSTDTGCGLGLALEWLSSGGVPLRAGVLAPPLNPALPYWAERELLFYEKALACGCAVELIERVAGVVHSDVVQAVRRFFDCQSIPPVVFIPEQSYVATFLTLAAERGLVLGRDLHLIMTDYKNEFADTPGIVALEQPFEAMYRYAVEWVLNKGAGRLQLLLAPALHTCDERS
jgi:hypothetical protein